MSAIEDDSRLTDTIGSREWRLRNLYWITDKDGKKVRFVPNDAQLHLLNNLWYLNVILKARQRGFTTLVCILWLDTILFNSNTRCGIIADTLPNAQVIFRDKIKFAYDNLPDALKAKRPAIKNEAGELLLSNNSSIRVGTSMRSGTLQYLLISEFGKICRKYPEKAQEVMTGSLNAVAPGQFVIVESTAEGQGGEYYEMCRAAEADKLQGKTLGKMDYKFHFYSWWDADEYELDPLGVIITDEEHQYFDEVERQIGREIGIRKRAWYVKKRATQRDKMRQEYPSTPKEAFETAIEGAYYRDNMAQARSEGRISVVPVIPSLPVHTFWDLGRNDMNSIWFMQVVGVQYRFVRYYENSGEGLAHYAKYLRDTGYMLGDIYLPHDACHQLLGQETTVDQQLGEMMRGCSIKVVQRIQRTTDGINMLRDKFSQCWFDEKNCAAGITHLDNYRKQWNDALGIWRDQPLHDIASNGADAIRQFAQGFTEDFGVKVFARNSSASWR
jgi:hypothetical protein